AAFPPCSRILMPAAVAAGLPETTTPWLPVATLGPRRTAGVLVACGHAKGASNRRQTEDTEIILRINLSVLIFNTGRHSSMSSIKRDVKKKVSASTGVEIGFRHPAHCPLA